MALASDALGALGDDEVPASLRPFRRWAPARRTKLAATPLAAAVEHDVLFRQRCGTRLREAMPDLVAALEAETVPAAADPIDVAAVANTAADGGWAAARHQRGRRPPHAGNRGGGDVAGGRAGVPQDSLSLAVRSQVREGLCSAPTGSWSLPGFLRGR